MVRNSSLMFPFFCGKTMKCLWHDWASLRVFISVFLHFLFASGQCGLSGYIWVTWATSRNVNQTGMKSQYALVWSQKGYAGKLKEPFDNILSRQKIETDGWSPSRRLFQPHGECVHQTSLKKKICVKLSRKYVRTPLSKTPTNSSTPPVQCVPV